MKMKRSGWMTAAIAATGFVMVLSAQAVTYTWSQGAGTGSANQIWGTSANWVGSPTLTFNNETDLIFDTDSVVNRANALAINGNRTIRSLTINANYETSNNNTFDIQTYNTINTTARNLTFEAASGNASISVAQSTSGTVQIRLGSNAGGDVVLNSNLDLAQNNTFFGNTGFQFESKVSGAGTINKTGAGLVRMVRDNSGWSGGMNINEGEVSVFANANAMGTGTWTLGGGGNNTTFSVGSVAVQNNTGGLVVAAGAGTRTIALMSTTAGNPTLAGTITLNKNASFDVGLYVGGTHDRLTLSNVVSGDGGIVKTNDGILILSAANTNTGVTDIQAGKLYLAGAGRLGSGNVTIASGANLDFAAGNSTTPNIVANNISGAGQIFQNVAGTDTRITGNITSTGGLTIEAGTFRIGDGTTTGSYTGNTLINGGVLAFARSDAYTHGGTISGAGGVSKVSTGDVTLTGNNSYSGNTALFTGVLVADHANALGTGNIVFNSAGGGGTLRYTADSAGTDWASRIKSSSAAIRLDTSGNNVTLAGAIDDSNNAGLVKSGAGILTLTGENAYSGGTTVQSGTLLVNNVGFGSGTGSGAVTVNSGAKLGGTGIISGDITIETGAFLAPGASFGTLEGSNVTLEDGAKLQWELSGNATEYGNGQYDRLLLSGNLEANDKAEFDFLSTGYWSGSPTVYTLIQFAGTTGVTKDSFTIKADSLAPGLSSGGFAIVDNAGTLELQLTVIPEPASLGALGLIAVAAILRRRLRR